MNYHLQKQARQAHRVEMRSERQGMRLHDRAVRSALHGNIGRAINLEARSQAAYFKAQSAHHCEIAARTSAQALHHHHHHGPPVEFYHYRPPFAGPFVPPAHHYYPPAHHYHPPAPQTQVHFVQHVSPAPTPASTPYPVGSVPPPPPTATAYPQPYPPPPPYH